MTRFIFAGIALAMLAGDGLVFGLMSQRWQAAPRLAAAAASLDRVPMEFGDWKGRERDPLNEAVLEQAGFTNHFLRTYENRRTGAVMNVLLACGPSGPLCGHSPEICYGGSGHIQQEPMSQHTEVLGESLGTVSLMKTRFARANPANPSQLRVFWSWKGSDGWIGSTNPRWAFAGQAALFKLYVTQEVLAADNAKAAEAPGEFLRAFMPELEKVLTFER